MGDEHVRVEDPGAGQDLDRGDAVPGEGGLGLVAVLGGVQMDGQPVGVGEFGGGGEVGVVHRVGGVRGERGGDAAVRRSTVPQCELQGPLAPLGALGGEVRLPQQRPHPALGDHGGDRVHGEVVVREAGDAAPDHLRAGEPRAQFDVPLAEVGLHGPDDVVEPVLRRQVLGETAQRHHRGVRVTVDQTGQRHLPPAVDPLVGRQPRDGVGAGDLRHGSVAHDDGRVLDEPDPFLIVVREDGASGDDEPGGTLHGRRRHPDNVRRVPDPE